MTLITTALGGFYVLAAILVLRRARSEWLIDRAIEEITLQREPDRNRIYFMTGTALLYGAAGIALLFKSSLAVWLLGAGLLLQAGYYGGLRLIIGADDREDGERWRKAWNAGIVSTASFAFAAYAMRCGILG